VKLFEEVDGHEGYHVGGRAFYLVANVVQVLLVGGEQSALLLLRGVILPHLKIKFK